MPSAGPNLTIQGCYNNANFGDALLMDVMSHHVDRRLGVMPSCPWVHPASRPHVTTPVGGGWPDVFRSTAAFFGGGGYFCDYFRRSLNYSIPARVWAARDVPYVVAGVGVGPFITPAAERQFEVVCRGAQAICVRDEESKEQLATFGAPAERIEVTADAVLSLTPDMIPADAMAEAKSMLGEFAAGRRLFGIQWAAPGPRSYTLSPPFLARDPHPSLLDLLAALKRSLRGREEEVGLVWLLNHNRSTTAAIREAVEAEFPGSLFLRSRNHWVIAALLSLLDGVFTTMLHLGITAWVLGTPPCAWASHGKTQRFYRQIGRDRFVASLSEPSDAVEDWIRTFVDAPDAFAVEAPDARERLSALAHRNYEVIAEHLAPALRG